MELTLVHPGPPIPKARPRHGGNGTYTPQRTMDAEAGLGWAMRAARPRGWRLDAFYALECRFHLGSFRRIDTDNLLKLVMDAGNKILWDDDFQVVEEHCFVVRGDPNPRTEVQVRTVPNPHFDRKK